MPTPTIPGGHGLPPAPTIDSSTNRFTPFTPSAGTHIFRKLMFSRARALGHALHVEPVPVGDELPVHDRQPVADVRPGVLARDRVHRVRAQRVLDRRARGAVAQRLVDPRRDAAGSARRRGSGRRRCRCPGRRGSSRCRRSLTLRWIVSRTRLPGTDVSRARASASASRRSCGMSFSAQTYRCAAASSTACWRSVATGTSVIRLLPRLLGGGAPARRPKTTHSSSELPIMRFRPCVPPAISPQA